jgi:membrane protein YqaA with SNARE-associated domain
LWAQRTLLPLGGWGLFPAAFLDSSFLSLAGGVDLWLISLCVFDPARMPVYVAIATVGSVAGCCALYFAALKGKEVFVGKKRPASDSARVRQRLEKYETLALMVAAVLPPPTPFKLFVLTSGVMKLRFSRFVSALLVGRTLRYFIEGVLAVHYGRQSWAWLLRSGPVLLGMMALVVVLALLARRAWRKAPSIGS